MDTKEIATALTVAALAKFEPSFNENGARAAANFYRHLVKLLDEPLPGQPLPQPPA